MRWRLFLEEYKNYLYIYDEFVGISFELEDGYEHVELLLNSFNQTPMVIYQPPIKPGSKHTISLKFNRLNDEKT